MIITSRLIDSYGALPPDTVLFIFHICPLRAAYANCFGPFAGRDFTHFKREPLWNRNTMNSIT